MPRMTATDEIAHLRAEQARLAPIVATYAAELAALDALRHKISLAYSEAWRKKERIERRLFELERRIKICKPATGEAKPASTKTAAKDLLKSLTPAQVQALIAALSQKGAGV